MPRATTKERPKHKVDPKSILRDPVKLFRLCWPDMRLYDKQEEILHSLVENDETYVPAGNQLGKDFITGYAVLWFFCSRSPARVITSSAGQRQLSAVLWGEMRRFIHTSKYPLPIDPKTLLLHQLRSDGTFEPRSYVQGVVTNVAENMLGHHLERGINNYPRTMAVFDEASSIANEYYEATDTWAHRKLIIGNPLPCVNFFYSGVKGGDIWRDDEDHSKGKFINVIKIKAVDSPNVKLAEAEIAAGKEVSYTQVIPGVVSYLDYVKRRKLWDAVRQSVGLDAEFYEGGELLLYPVEWLNESEKTAAKVKARFTMSGQKRKGEAIGIDTAEGGDFTCWTVVDYYGILEKVSIRTNDTAVIPPQTLALMDKWGVPPEQVIFDLGGGGKQHADVMRKAGFKVRTLGFGQAPTVTKKFNEQKMAYKNMRSELYGLLMLSLEPIDDPDDDRIQFAIPAKYTELRRQLAPMPKCYDSEGRLFLPPKDKSTPNYKGETIKQIIGCSPDEADSLVLAHYALVYPKRKIKIGVM